MPASLLEIDSRDTVTLDRHGEVWLVEGGALDVFLARVAPGGTAGSKQHVCRVGRGEAVLGVEPCGDEAARIVVDALPGTRVLRAALADLSAAEVGTDTSALIAGVDAWVRHLSEACAAGARVGPWMEIPAAGSCHVPDATSVQPRSGVAWVGIPEGVPARFLGDANLAPLSGPTCIPLTASTWLEVGAACTVSTNQAAAMAERGTLGGAIRAFHQLAVRRLAHLSDAADHAERERLQRRLDADSRRMDRALRGLASPLAPLSDVAAPAPDDDDPWLQACRALEDATGIRFHGPPGRRTTLVKRAPVEAIARASGVRWRQVALRADWWTQDCGPLLARREADKSPVALIPVTPTRYEAWDPATRVRMRVDAAVAGGLEAFATQFYRPLPTSELHALDLLRFGLRGSARSLAAILASGLGAGLLATATPLVTGIVFDAVIPDGARSQMGLWFVVLVIAAVCATLFRALQAVASIRLESRLDVDLQAAIWDRLLALPVPFFRAYTAADLAERGLAVTAMREVVTESVLPAVLAGVFSVFTLALMFVLDWRLALVGTALTLVTAAVTAGGGALRVRAERQAATLQGRTSSLLLQFLNGISKLRASGSEDRAFEVWAEAFTQQKTAAVRGRKVGIALVVFSSGFPALGTAVMYWAMVALGDGRDTLTTGMALAFLAAFAQLQAAALALSTALVSVLAVVPLFERASPILAARPEVDPTRRHPGELTGAVEVRHVTFRYDPDGPVALNDVSLKAAPGRFVAIVGPSGSGKSTLLRLLIGFERPESGAVYFDNQDLAHLDVQAVRYQMGVVLQAGRLVADSIYKNIVGSAPLTIEDAWQAARLAGLEDDIKAMPMGMHTVISEGGGLSGGQRQRLMIARAIVRRPRIVLFDEATSALDNETQAIVSRSLENLKATRIVIAHRLSTIARADWIYVIEKGAVAQEGTFDDLIRTPGPFADLARRQLA